MKEEILYNKDLILNERVKELEDSDEFVEYKMVFKPIPTKVLDDFYDKISHKRKGRVTWDDYFSEITTFMSGNPEYRPVSEVVGRKASNVDIAVLLSIISMNINQELSEVIDNLGKVK